MKFMPHVAMLVALPLLACPMREHSKVREESPKTPAPVAQPVPGDGPTTAYVRRIYEDSRGQLWLGSNGEGVYRYTGVELLRTSTKEGLAGDQVRGILEDRQGCVWIATDQGLSRFDSSMTRIVNFTAQDGLGAAAVWCVHEATDGTIWAGTTAGACRFDGQSFIPFDLRTADMAAPFAPSVLCIAEDRAGNFYFGTDQGAYKTNRDGVERITDAPTGSDAVITCLLVDGRGRIWIGSMTGGITCTDAGATRHYTAPGTIGDNEVWTVLEDRAGNIWFSSEGFGVYSVGDGNLKNIGTAEGLGITAVQSIHEDRQGRLWFGGGGGLYRMQGDTLVEVRRTGPWR